MARFRLKTGRYIGKGGRVYKQGDVVESHVDLVTIGGAEKFERLDGKPSASRNQFPVTPGSTSAPGGQVHSGTQETGQVDEDGNPISGPQDVETDPETEEALNPEGEGADPGDGSETDVPDFDKMSVKQLKDWSTENGVDLEGAKTKPDIIKKLKGE